MTHKFKEFNPVDIYRMMGLTTSPGAFYYRYLKCGMITYVFDGCECYFIAACHRDIPDCRDLTLLRVMNLL